MIKWDEVQTVLLDMDGTLLDLHFDDYFWQTQLPQKWGERNGMDIDTARSELLPIFQDTEGTLLWYCLDYWSEQLDMDVFELNIGLEHLIRPRPHAKEFLEHLQAKDKQVVLVTNSHEKFISLKMKQTGLECHFDQIFNSHSFGAPKEDVKFWEKLSGELDFVEENTVLVDDNLHVLRAARAYGIRHLLSIARPSSQSEIRDTEEFQAIDSFLDFVRVEPGPGHR